jgi:guanine deaminase
MTLGNALSLSLADRIGTLDAGSDADIVVLTPPRRRPWR